MVLQAEGLCKSFPDYWIYHRWVKSWIAHYIDESPHIDISTSVCVCVAMSHNHPRGGQTTLWALKVYNSFIDQRSNSGLHDCTRIQKNIFIITKCVSSEDTSAPSSSLLPLSVWGIVGRSVLK